MDINKTLAEAEKLLQERDLKLAKIINSQKPISYTPREDYFQALCNSIVSQQLSISSAAAIFARFEITTKLVPSKVASLSDSQIKQIGLSKQKASYLIDLAKHFIEDPKVYNHLENSTDDEVIEELTEIKGIGLWTAQMFLMFTLLRLDVFPLDDVGIQRAMIKLYNIKSNNLKDEMTKISNKWKPYRTVACWHLWDYLDK